jgi:hypothetical protein
MWFDEDGWISPTFMPIAKTKNENFFKTWTPEMAYVLGFFAADGSMNRNKRGGCYIEFQITDGDLLKKIRALLQSDNVISVRKRAANWQPIHRLQIGSRVIFGDLARLGFVQNKTAVLSLPSIPEDFFSHFVRGYFDGDGNVWSGIIHKLDRPHPSRALAICFTSGSEGFLQSLKDELRIFANTTGGSLCYSRAFRLRYASEDSLKLYRFMYYDSGGLYLPRKKEVFDSFVKNR